MCQQTKAHQGEFTPLVTTTDPPPGPGQRWCSWPSTRTASSVIADMRFGLCAICQPRRNILSCKLANHGGQGKESSQELQVSFIKIPRRGIWEGKQCSFRRTPPPHILSLACKGEVSLVPSLGWGWLTSSLDSWGQTSSREGLFSQLEFSTASLHAAFHTLLFDPHQLLSRVSGGLGVGRGGTKGLHSQPPSPLPSGLLSLWLEQGVGRGLEPTFTVRCWEPLVLSWPGLLWSPETLTRWAVSRGQRWGIKGGQDSGDQRAKQSHY